MTKTNGRYSAVPVNGIHPAIGSTSLFLRHRTVGSLSIVSVNGPEKNFRQQKRWSGAVTPVSWLPQPFFQLMSERSSVCLRRTKQNAGGERVQ